MAGGRLTARAKRYLAPRMRIGVLFLFLALAFGSPAAAQTLAGMAAAVTPAKPAASAIIPGSPLATLTGAGAAPASDDTAAAPFGTDAIGLSVATAIGSEAKRCLAVVSEAARHATALTPVLEWLRSFRTDPVRQTDLFDIGKALAMTLAAGLGAEAVIDWALRRPRAAVAARIPVSPDAALQDEADEAAQGLADAEAGETEERPGRRVSLLAMLRRFLLGLLHFGLRLVPLAGFVLAIELLILSGVLTTRPAHLAVIGIANAYLFCRVGLEVVGLLLAPDAPSLRLIPMPQFRARRLVSSLAILLGTGFFGFALISICEVLGLAKDGAIVLIRLVALAVHVEIAIGIWESRRVVGRWIAGRPDASGATAAIRQRLGVIWHYPALFYILALWVALAGGVHNAFGLLLRIVLVFIAALILGRLAWNGSTTLLERAFPDPETTQRHRVLFARARAYNPLLRGLIRVLIGVLMIVMILQGWGVNAIGWLFTNPVSHSLITAFIDVVVTVALALIAWESANFYLNSRVERLASTSRAAQASRLRTLLPMLRAAIGTVILLLAVFICLSRIGVNATPLLAVSGVAGIAIGFGSQKLVQDIITGLFLLLEDAMQVGDVITLAGMTGTVERLSIRTIRLRGADGSVNIIPFSAVTTVTNLTRDFSYAQLSIDVSYESDLTHVYEVLRDIAKTMRGEPAWEPMIRDDLQLYGLDAFGASALTITGRIRTSPGQQWAVRREFYARVKTRFAVEGIEIPYTYLPPAPVVEAPGEKEAGQGAPPLGTPPGPVAPEARHQV